MTVELVVDHIRTEIYMDDLQLTNSSFFTRYNLIENGYMEFADSDNRPHGWSFQNLYNEDAIAMIDEDNIHSLILGNHVMRIAPGDVEKVDLLNDYKMKRMSKAIPMTGLAGEQFIFSVFAKVALLIILFSERLLNLFMKIKILYIHNLILISILIIGKC